MRNQFRLRLALALSTSLALISSDALAIDPGACCVQSTSRLETLMSPTKGSDEKFFTSAGGPPNVMLILDSSCSMQEWPEDWPSTKGCTHATFAGNGYDPNINYRGFISGMTGSPGNKTPTYNNNWFNPDVIYRADGTGSYPSGATFGHDFRNSGAPAGTKWADGTYNASRDDACNVVTGAVAADITTCKACLDNSGYYVQDATTRIASGNYLKYYNPKEIGAILVLSQLVFDIREVRLGIMTFSDWGGSCLSPGNSWGPTCLWQPMKPNCNQLYPFDTSSVESARNSILNSLAKDTNAFDSNTPLATNLYMAGWHLKASASSPDGYDNVFAGSYPGNGSTCASGTCTFTSFDEPGSANQHSICTGCTFNATIILTDGQPYNELITTWPSEITSRTTYTAPYCPAGSGACDSYLDEIASFLYNTDLRPDLPGTQKVATYTIGFGTSVNANQLLASTAKVGGGKFYAAQGAADVNAAILSIFDDIAARNNSFSSSAVASVQTGSTSTPALLPRMLPKAGQPWEGKLWRFEQYNEFVETTASTLADLNGDGDNADVFIVDNTNAIVTETADGTFVRNGTPVLATPFWEANDKLVTDLSGTYTVDDRRIFTVVDSDGDGAFTSTDTLVRFQPNATNDLKLAEYMGLVGSSFCPNGTVSGSLLTKWGMSLAQAQTVVGTMAGTTEADYAKLCARLVMRWVEGADFYDLDGDSNRTEVRPNVMGDIFHASPVIVEPPVDTFLCELGLSNQCVRTLYSQALQDPTPINTGTTTTLVGADATNCPNTVKNAYEAYVWDQRRRDKVVLVGANDGMVHAFLSGHYLSEACAGGQATPTFDKGTGKELWAFIPPDLLPKLPDLILSHEYMVDGDIMVRDIWADSSSGGIRGTKEEAEFHTLAIVAEGRGGKHYFALEMKYDAAGNAATTPSFRWMFPQPCSEEAATFGKTLFALSPKPPPVGPMLVDNATLQPTGYSGGVTRYGATSHERWMVAISGGWSAGQDKGRGIYLLDAWFGQVNNRRDNLWWKFEFVEGASGSSNQPKKELTNSVAAPIALVDYGTDATPGQDGFFDTAVFTDTAGQVWVARMQTPGTVSTAGSKNTVNNWFAARAFEMDRDGVPGAAVDTTLPDGGTDPADTVNAKSVANKWPFFYLPSVAIEPGTDRMRVFAGTGNRYAILETGPGMCRFDNPLACAKANCSDTNVTSTYKDAVVKVDKAHTHWKKRRFEHGKLDETILTTPTTLTMSATDMCGTNGSKRVEAEYTDFKVGTCDVIGTTDPNPGKVNESRYECGLNASGSSFSCTRKSLDRVLEDLLDPSTIDSTGLGKNRFIGFWAYGGLQADGGYRGFSGTTGTTPLQYDNARVSDRSTASPGSGELFDITKVGCTALSCDGGAPEDSYGWFYTYSGIDQKTATGAAIIASCVLWSDLSPTGGDGGLCGAAITPSSSIYQADFLTGQPNCAYGFLPTDGGAYARSQTRTVVAPPPEPASVVQVSKSGVVRYSAMIVEPGQGQATTVNVSGGQDVLQLVYELPVSRSLHNCRHAGTAGAGCSTVP